ncbi:MULTISPECIES: hypothetical protein [unclassified Paraburkholderia]|uniref:hypothetical protein n=1 Tax=unclassified Paraburkholderia TaxID=2615204 RepID=UPI00161D6F98|nr:MULTISPECIES: hypothetical protein [unclassified Paraburkholderia]MBB5448228.1 GNAT superfamily N-acetyltransferase [Paraburkholderia sp. WSM4177]MBB5488597.1 GNAT superfamily N-acetyltransferase [Paraburkholderia sp. WSM4180]
MNAKIYAQQDCNYRHITDTINMLAAAVHEVNPDAQPDPVKALQAITLAVTGARKDLYFAVAEVNGITAGFIGGALSNFAFEDRTYGQDILTYVLPEHRGTTAERDLSEQFVGWCFGMGASEVRGYLTNIENAERFARAATRYGWETQGTIIVRKRGE